jgi:exonuclease-1
MGIQGLWPLLKDCIRSGHVGEFRGRRVAVDAYVWLHRAVFGCCVELAQGQPSDKWLKYCIEMIDFLLALDISVYLVFDGG